MTISARAFLSLMLIYLSLSSFAPARHTLFITSLELYSNISSFSFKPAFRDSEEASASSGGFALLERWYKICAV